MEDTNTIRPTVVCLHGSASNSSMWRDFTDTVRGRCRVITPDLFAGDLNAQLDCIGGPFHLVGHGYGGSVALAFAARFPERVLSLVLYEPADAEGVMDLPCDVPVRLISGTRSWNAARRCVERISERLSNSTLLKLVGLRHMAPVTHPRLVSAVILDYILPVSMPEQVRAA